MFYKCVLCPYNNVLNCFFITYILLFHTNVHCIEVSSIVDHCLNTVLLSKTAIKSNKLVSRKRSFLFLCFFFFIRRIVSAAHLINRKAYSFLKFFRRRMRWNNNKNVLRTDHTNKSCFYNYSSAIKVACVAYVFNSLASVRYLEVLYVIESLVLWPSSSTACPWTKSINRLNVSDSWWSVRSIGFAITR